MRTNMCKIGLRVIFEWFYYVWRQKKKRRAPVSETFMGMLARTMHSKCETINHIRAINDDSCLSVSHYQYACRQNRERWKIVCSRWHHSSWCRLFLRDSLCSTASLVAFNMAITSASPLSFAITACIGVGWAIRSFLVPTHRQYYSCNANYILASQQQMRRIRNNAETRLQTKTSMLLWAVFAPVYVVLVPDSCLYVR